MADISKEIQDFQEAEYGEEVRSSMVSLAEKINSEVETDTANVEAYKNEVDAQLLVVDGQISYLNQKEEEILSTEKKALDYSTNAIQAAQKATQAEKDSDYAAKISQSYAVGGSNSREYEDIDNAKYYSESASSSADAAKTLLEDATDLMNAAVKEVSGYNFFVDEADGCLYVNTNVKTTTFGIDALDGYLYVEVI